MKRRGELKLIKVFQAEVFEQFLGGGSLEECYHCVAAVANRWLDMLDTRGEDLTDEELIEYISEASVSVVGLAGWLNAIYCLLRCWMVWVWVFCYGGVRERGLLACWVLLAAVPGGVGVLSRRRR